MNECSNCGGKVLGNDVVHVAHRGRVVAALCTECTATAAKPRITLSRSKQSDLFEYEQYVCVEATYEP